VPKPLNSIVLPSIKAFSKFLQNVSIIDSNSERLSFGFFSLSFFISSGRDNYFSFLLFLPIAFSKIPLSVAPDFVAPSPNLAIKDFSSSI
jgi:hypothetical protein